MPRPERTGGNGWRTFRLSCPYIESSLGGSEARKFERRMKSEVVSDSDEKEFVAGLVGFDVGLVLGVTFRLIRRDGGKGLLDLEEMEPIIVRFGG